jgi:hypothetical protein
MEDKQFKPTDNAFAREIRSDLEMNMDKFRDPVVLGEFVYRLLEERENTNRLLKNILAKLEARGMGPAIQIAAKETLLPEIDEQIMSFVKDSGKVTAEEVRVKFNYRGKNAACARLNRLCDSRLIQKRQVGKKMFFFPV